MKKTCVTFDAIGISASELIERFASSCDFTELCDYMARADALENAF